ncbi:MAG: putative lipid II flippase FtsW [Alkalispirochaeta sp.]
MTRHTFFADHIDSQDHRFDPVFLALVLVLIILGLGMLWSASWYRAQQLYGEPLRFVLRHGMWMAAGILVMGIGALIPLQWIRRLLPVIVLGSVAVSLMTFVPGISARYMGAQRWIILFNVSFQPSEILKATMVIYLAHILSRRDGDFDDPVHTLIPPVIIVFVFAGIVLLQNDFSTAVFIGVVAAAMFYTAGVPHHYFAGLLTLSVPVTVIMLFTREHRVRRIIAFLNPNYDPSGSGYQILAARRALENGGFWGAGVGRGTRKFGGLPEAQSDFLFAVAAEELGFVGVVVIIALFLLLFGRGLYLARRQEDPFRSLLIFGLITSVFLQALLNIAVVAGAVPATGIPLPFFSAGGSSLVITFAMCGLILNASGVEQPQRTFSMAGVDGRVWDGSHG